MLSQLSQRELNQAMADFNYQISLGGTFASAIQGPIAHQEQLKKEVEELNNEIAQQTNAKETLEKDIQVLESEETLTEDKTLALRQNQRKLVEIEQELAEAQEALNQQSKQLQALTDLTADFSKLHKAFKDRQNQHAKALVDKLGNHLNDPEKTKLTERLNRRLSIVEAKAVLKINVEDAKIINKHHMLSELAIFQTLREKYPELKITEINKLMKDSGITQMIAEQAIADIAEFSNTITNSEQHLFENTQPLTAEGVQDLRQLRFALSSTVNIFNFQRLGDSRPEVKEKYAQIGKNLLAVKDNLLEMENSGFGNMERSYKEVLMAYKEAISDLQELKKDLLPSDQWRVDMTINTLESRFENINNMQKVYEASHAPPAPPPLPEAPKPSSPRATRGV